MLFIGNIDIFQNFSSMEKSPEPQNVVFYAMFLCIVAIVHINDMMTTDDDDEKRKNK